MRFILASESPRRVALLQMVGYDFEVRKSGFPEVVIEGDPEETVRTNASGKALAVASEYPGEVILAADTIVYLPAEDEILGQAKTAPDVYRMLGLLTGRVHEVYSGLAVARDGDISIESVMTRVHFRDLSASEVAAYVELGEGIGKAGGYAIQGTAALFVERIEGDYSNVVGLPLATTSLMLGEYDIRWY